MGVDRSDSSPRGADGADTGRRETNHVLDNRRNRPRPGILKHPQSGTYFICFQWRGKEVRLSAAKLLKKPPREVTEADAVRALNRQLRKMSTYVGPENERARVADVLDEYRTHLELKGARVGSYSSKFDRLRDDLGQIKAAVLSTAHIERWTKAALEDLAPGTVNVALGVLSGALHHARKAGRLAAVPYFPRLRVKNARQGFFEREAVEKVLAALDGPVSDLVRFLYMSGWRREEGAGLTWSMVDLQAGTITLPDSKNGEGRTIPFYGELGGLMGRRWKARAIGCQYVFHRRGRRILNFRGAWLNACTAAGVPGMLVHDLRRTAVRDLIRAGVSEPVAMSITGHRSREVFRRYDITSCADKGSALERLDGYRAAMPASNVVPMRGQR